MKKIALSSVVILAFLVYALHQSAENSEAMVPPNKALTGSTPAITTVPSNTNLPQSTEDNPTDTPAPASSSTSAGLKDGIYTGSSVNVFYGNVQVQAIITGGKLTDIKFLDYPQDRGHSIEVSNYSLPTLKSEAIQSQSAQVDTVTGATQTSEGFIQSLQSALDQAKG